MTTLTTRGLSLLDLADAPLSADAENARLHDDKNIRAINASLDEVGGGRSIVTDENGVILAGNGTYEVAKKRGMKVVFVDVDDRNTIVAVRRSDLTPREKRRLALWDNRASDLGRYHAKQMKAFAEQGFLEDLFDADQVAKIKEEGKILAAFPKVDEDIETAYGCPACGYEWSGNPRPSKGNSAKAADADANGADDVVPAGTEDAPPF